MRTIFVRSLQSVLTFAAVALLTGANDAGCGLGTVIGGDGSGGGVSQTASAGSGTVDPTAPNECPSGTVLQLVCDPAPSGGGGIPIEECDGPNCPPPPPGCDPADPDCTSPYPGDEVPQPPPCDPADPDCSSPPSPCDPADPNCTSPYPGDDVPQPLPCDPADPNCIPPMPCEPGGAECPPPPPPPPPPGCFYACVPADQVCPPGTSLVTVCTDSSGSEGTAGGSPSTPPGGPDTPVDGGGCWTECMPNGCGGEVPTEPPQPGEPQQPSEPQQPK
jgi:hypothetical protein